MNSLLYLSFILFSVFNVSAGEVFLVAKLSPAGTMEIKSGKLLGQIIESKGEYTAKKLYLAVTSLESGVELRDQHIHKYLGMDKPIQLTNLKIDKKTLKGKGKLEINKVQKEILFQVNRGRDKDSKNLYTKFIIDQRDFQLPKAEFMGISVEPKLDVSIKIYPRDITREDQQ